MIDAEKLAELEIMWWEAYHMRQWPNLEEAVKKLRKEQYDVEIDNETAHLFTLAALSYISYKKAHSEYNDKSASYELNEARRYIQQHYENIQKLVDENESNKS